MSGSLDKSLYMMFEIMKKETTNNIGTKLIHEFKVYFYTNTSDRTW